MIKRYKNSELGNLHQEEFLMIGKLNMQNLIGQSVKFAIKI